MVESLNLILLKDKAKNRHNLATISFTQNGAIPHSGYERLSLKRRSLLFCGSFFVGTIVGLGAYLYQRRSRNRIPSVESLDDPEFVRAYGDVSRMPPWKLLRWYVSRRALALKNVGEAVDLGCGPGYLAVDLAKRSQGLHITGVDSSEEMRIQAEMNVDASRVSDRVSFRIGNAERIPFGDHSLDLVVSTFSLHHWTNPIAVMNEIARVLKPGAGYLIFDLRRDMAPPIYMLLWFVTHFIAPTPLRSANEPIASRDASYTPQEVEKLLSESNLENGFIVEGPAWLSIEGKIPLSFGERASL
jgi:ubiquinone/menaquinone biosynthesis C-methylase UbiE